MYTRIFNFFFNNKKQNKINIKKFLIVGLGNPGNEYINTRHNIGFSIIDHYCEIKDLKLNNIKYGVGLKTKLKGKTILILKPSTYMNLSGKAIIYWKNKENIALENILIITDDLNLPSGSLRLKSKGSDGGHNGLKDIEVVLKTSKYPRLRFGIKIENRKKNNVDFVLGEWSENEKKTITQTIKKTIQIIDSFIINGITNTMNSFNNK